MATSSKILDYLDSFSVKPYFIADSAAQYAKSSSPATTPFVNPLDYSLTEDNLHWDEYGNPYIVDNTIR